MTKALPAGPVARRRALFGLLDADGWAWPTVKAFFWFIFIIFILGYIPDRAYYFTVNKTLDLGILAWSPVNLCAAANETLPCPAPVGAIQPWHPSPPELALPEPRTDGALAQAGTKLLYIGGADETGAQADVFVATIVQVGNFDRWQAGPALPAPRSNAAVASLGGSIYVIGGLDEAGKPTKTTFVLSPDLQTGELGEWKTAKEADQPIDLPEARDGGSLVALGDGLLFVGGADADGNPTSTAWKSKLNRQGKLGKWVAQATLFDPTADGTAVLNGDYVWLFGGRNASGPVGGVQRGTVPSTGDKAGQVVSWGTGFGPNLPAARMNAGGFLANGALYLVGGNDGSGTRGELYWATPAAGSQGDVIPEWKHLAPTDLPAPGLEGAGVAINGPNVFLVGGTSGGTIQTGSVRANLAPEAPFFRVGLVGATVPALKIEGEIGQQLGYLNAAGAGTVDFVILILIGLAYAYPHRTRAIIERIRRRRA